MINYLKRCTVFSIRMMTRTSYSKNNNFGMSFICWYSFWLLLITFESIKIENPLLLCFVCFRVERAEVNLSIWKWWGGSLEKRLLEFGLSPSKMFGSPLPTAISNIDFQVSVSMFKLAFYDKKPVYFPLFFPYPYPNPGKNLYPLRTRTC